jgi:hypothetical protein
MNRRSFLSISAGVGGSCLIPSAIARRIRDVCIGNSHPLILAPDHSSFELFAEKTFDRYLLHLGDPGTEPDYPNLREFIEDKGYSPDNRRSLRDYLINWRCHDVETEGRTKHAIDEIVEMLDEPIDNYERENWMEWDFEMHDSPMARAYSYLRDLPLDDGRSRGDFDLGSLSFIEGDRPGSNLTYVEADSLAAVASLQHRLNELKTGARIVVA